ncbi:hypothetical protein EW026_g6962 [Hermanssonia centrifuga]|uniref:ATP-dependent DNA helicase II subunit 2 n=1 Tax=Hermanssonia centrifuga TaxID=98765 RepID=A0A4S4K9C1_9APHY|nr:hypothetical protein EW026_g6962 [Hermanssonia centrifuga]
MAERAGYTVTMFLVDVSPSMGKTREVEMSLPNGKTQTVEMTNLEWSLQFVKLKIQEMIYNGRKTDQCGVILFGTEGEFYILYICSHFQTENIVHSKDGGYDHVYEYIPIAQPTAATLAKLSGLEPSTDVGDPIDALIVGIETQDKYLGKKKTWTRKMVLLTDGENPIEVEDWEETAKKMNLLGVRLSIIGVDFDDDEYPFHEEDKSGVKSANETFFHTFVDKLEFGIVGNCALALEEISRPEVKSTKSALMGTVLRLGDVEDRPEEAVEILVKASKCTAVARPKSFKKFAVREKKEDEDIIMEDEDEDPKDVYAQLAMRTEYFVDHNADKDEEDDEEPALPEAEDKSKRTVIDKEQLVRGYKYGSSYAPCPDGNFPRLETKKGIDICGFFLAKHFRRELSMGEVQYIWADPSSPVQQVALSSVVEAMYEKGAMAIARWVSKDGMDPKMGVLAPTVFENVDCFLWVQMPFADDVRKYTFASLDKLINKKGEPVTKHPYIPTEKQLEAMENFVDAMDLMQAGEEDEEGNREAWYDTRYSYNPAIHRTKQALFHGAVVSDLRRQPLPPPHPELLKYFEPPKRVLKRARHAIEDVKVAFKVKEVPRRVVRARKDGHFAAQDDDNMLLLDKVAPSRNKPSRLPQSQSQTQIISPPKSQKAPLAKKGNDSDSETESEGEYSQHLLLDLKRARLDEDTEKGNEGEPMLPTPLHSPSRDISGREPGMIIGSVHPLEDFKRNIASGDLVTKAVEDLGTVIKTIALKPFSESRVEEMLECMQELRRVALEEDEIDAWNAFLRDLKRECVKDEESGSSDFWRRVTELGRNISLIGQLEAAKLGGDSDVSEAQATAFIRQPV